MNTCAVSVTERLWARVQVTDGDRIAGSRVYCAR